MPKLLVLVKARFMEIVQLIDRCFPTCTIVLRHARIRWCLVSNKFFFSLNPSLECARSYVGTELGAILSARFGRPR